MKGISSLAFFFFVLYALQCSVEASDKVKIIEGHLNKLNGEYIDQKTLVISFVPINSTHNAVPVHWDVLQDFPSNTRLVSKIERSRKLEGPYEPYKTYDIVVSDKNDKYHDFLPQYLIDLTEEGKGIQKGSYDFKDAGYLRFWDLVPEEDLEGYYFKTGNQIRSDEVLILDMAFTLETNEKSSSSGIFNEIKKFFQ